MATGIGKTAYTSQAEAILTANLNTIANDANKLAAVAQAIDNTSALRENYAQFEFVLASIDLSAQSNPSVKIWLIERTDTTNYEDGGDSITPARAPDLILPLREINGAQRVKGECEINGGYFRALIGNRTGVAFASSGNTLKYRLYSDELNNT